MANVSAVLIGGDKVSEADLRATETPPETRSHIPLPHGEFLDMVHGTLDRYNWEIASQNFAQTELPDTVTHDLLVRLADIGAFPWAYAPKILKEYRNPRHEEFESRTMWAFNNATTEILKDRNIRDLPGSMSRFHRLGKELVVERGSWLDPNQLSLN
jgi:hypothetical protein